MKIAFDATSLKRKITGIEYYSLNLIKNLLKLDTHNEYVVLFRSQIHPELEEFRSKAKFLVCPSNNQIYCEQVWIPAVLRKANPDLAHFPAFPPGAFVATRHIMTVHDATMWKYPNATSWKNKVYMKPLTELALHRAEKIITVSESSREDISIYTKTSQDRIVNT